jgi:hypothetical protein
VVRHVIALGSPLSMAREPLPAAVRMTSIYSREDQIVATRPRLRAIGARRTSRCPGSHIGLAFNPAVYRVLARTLGAPDLETV